MLIIDLVYLRLDMFHWTDGRFGSYLLCRLTVICVVWFSFIRNIQVCLIPFCRGALPWYTLIWETTTVRVNLTWNYRERNWAHKNIDTPWHISTMLLSSKMNHTTHTPTSNHQQYTALNVGLKFWEKKKTFALCFTFDLGGTALLVLIYNDKNSWYNLLLLCHTLSS